ncbi:MAG: M3 family oligoendopeptidase [bacterium]|nr:M3 family oligoendopeptidase [bacterium]
MQQTVIDFSEIRVETPTLEGVRDVYAQINAALDRASTPQERQAAIRRWDELRRSLNAWESMANLNFEQDSRNQAYKAARDYCDELSPKLTAFDVELKRRLLADAQRPQLEQSFGRTAFALWEADVTAFEPAIEQELVQESRLSAQYTEIIASAQIAFDGKQLNLAGLAPYREDADRPTRHRAELAFWRFYGDNRAELDRIYDELVKLRHTMARKLGYENYISLGYKRMHRIDYDQRDVERYRDQIAHEVVPLAQRVIERRAQRLDLERAMFWDERIADPRGNARPKGDLPWIMARCQEAFTQMHPELAAFFRLMTDGHFIDMENRPGKAGGGFCTSFPTAGMPFIFGNFNGTAHDVEVLVHEMGHAFQSYRSRALPLSDYLWPTSESAEIESMGLEYLAHPQMERFFGKDAERFREEHLSDAFLFLPYGVAVDHFQHMVYANPDATPAERHHMWQQMEQRYLPWRQYGDLQHAAQGGLWQEKRHIYHSPFYYIDYTLAQCCALQFWARSRQDYTAAMHDYVALCSRGGEAPFQTLARGANLKSPFDEGVLTGVVAEARSALGLR